MLSERQKLVLIAIVEEYVRTNEPVGSLALSKRPELGFSTATLRNDMASLEEMGYLEKTHTSSGRIPSQKGYKLYVQDIIMRKQNDQLEFPLIDEIFNRPNITREEAITEAMDLVTEFTNYATIALGKTASNSTKENSLLDHKIISSEKRDKCIITKDKALILSTQKSLPETPSIEFNVMPSKPNFSASKIYRY